MSSIDPGYGVRPALRRPGFLRRLVSCIRLEEVLVLQGAPLLGAAFSMGSFGARTMLTIAVLAIGNVLLVSHVFVLNDWAGIEGDARDPNRAPRSFLARGASETEAGWLSLVLLIAALVVFASIGPAVMLVALAIAVLSALYSIPGVLWKGRPVVNSGLHLLGGTLHFLLGYVCFTPASWIGVAIGCYFGLVFAAGHLTHEARDHDSDARNGIRTNAVAFGRRQGVLASLALFTLAYLLLFSLAWLGFVPRLLAFVILLYPLHAALTLRVLRSGLDYRSLRQLQEQYRRIHAVIGLAMLLTMAPWHS